MIGLLCMLPCLGLPCLGLAAWVLILPPRPDYSGDDFELDNLRTTEGLEHE